MDIAHVIHFLKQLEGVDFEEVYPKTTFKCYRNKKNGGVQEVEVEILDAGPGERDRYHCTATSEDGKVATGNPASTIEAVLAPLHWFELDR
jgi:hypothetical protein